MLALGWSNAERFGLMIPTDPVTLQLIAGVIRAADDPRVWSDPISRGAKS